MYKQTHDVETAIISIDVLPSSRECASNFEQT